MCGIAGVVSFGPGPFAASPEYVARMRDTMVHRGPDGADLWISDDRRVGLGFRRLAIVDLSPQAMQPMANEDGTLRLVFNGEIYNHLELRRELTATGRHTWRTDHSDSEVLLHGYEEWGAGVLDRLRGMFGCALWDARRGELLLARDRMGIKPLYYSLHHGRLTFASEIKALLTDPEQQRAIDEEALYHYLSFLTVPAPGTLFQGIKKLEAGTTLRLRLADGDVKVERWYDVWQHVTPLTGLSDGEIAERILAELRDSVQVHKLSDVPVGVFLSGGIDSSTNAALFSEGGGEPVQTFSIGYDTDYSDYKSELPYARIAAEFVGADHHERLLSLDDLMEFLPRMVWLQDEPIADPVCVPVYYVSELARRSGVVVCQVGEGADELFWGYPSWKQLRQLQQLDDLPVPRAAKRLAVAAAHALGKGHRREVEYLRRGATGVPIFWSGAEAFVEAEKAELLSPRLRSDLRGLTSWDAIAPIHDRFQATASSQTALDWMSTVDLSLRLPELLLMRVDKMAMGTSLEGRVPFLDHHLVELALSIPEATRTRNGELKHILKRAVRGIIPDVLIDRPKQGFGVPVADWVLERLGDHARAELAAFTRETDILNRDAVLRIVDERRGADTWYLLNLALWWKEFIA